MSEEKTLPHITKEKCLAIVGRKWGPMYKYVAGAVWEDAYNAGWYDAVPDVNDKVTKAVLCGVMLALHEQHGWEREQLQGIWDRVLEILMEGDLEDHIERVEKELCVELVDGMGMRI